MPFTLPAQGFVLGQTFRPDLVATPVTGLIDALALILGTAGVGVLLWGAYGALTRLIGAETAQARGQKPDPAARSQYGPYLIMGMEFMIASSAVKTLATPDWQHIATLGGLVVARTLLSLSGRWESSGPAPAVERTALVEHVAAPALPGPAAEAVEQPAVAAATMTH
jgi:uncharacterized membrane protein